VMPGHVRSRACQEGLANTVAGRGTIGASTARNDMGQTPALFSLLLDTDH